MLLTPNEVAKIFRVSPAAIHKWISEGRLKAVTIQGTGRDLHRIHSNELLTLGLSREEITEFISEISKEAVA